MTFNRKDSFEDVIMNDWRWQPFLDYAIRSFLPFDPQPYPLLDEFIYREVTISTKSIQKKAQINTWACKTEKIRQARAACLEAGAFASVLNFVISPYNSYDIPFFGADFVTLASGHLIALDLQPVLKSDKLHTVNVWNKLRPIHKLWQDKLPSGGQIPLEAQKYFSPGFLWTRIPLGDEGDKIIDQVIYPAFIDYLNLYLQLVNEAEAIEKERALLLLDGQKNYMKYRSEKDPARNMLTRFYGPEWTESYIHTVLFDL